MTDPQAPVFAIKRFALHDGPGLRTTVFLQGCPMRCPWCHNPEGMQRGDRVWQDPSRCIDCATCVQVGGDAVHRLAGARPQYRIATDDQRAMTACVDHCPAGAMQFIARSMTVAEVMADVVADQMFYTTSAGGVTVSGGEPVLHAGFVAELLAAARFAGINTAIETCLGVPSASLARVLPICDRIYCDLKAPDAERHRQWTGVSLDLVLARLEQVAVSGVPTTVRIPAIPGHTDTPAIIAAIAALARSHHPLAVIELMPWNPLPASKYERLDRAWPYPITRMSDAELTELRQAIPA